MASFITDRQLQTITVDGVRHAPAEISRLAEGKDSFYASLADFLAEWFGPSPVLKVQTSGSTGTPKELWVEKKRMTNSARTTVSFLGLRPGNTALLCMPLQYIAGKMMVVRALVAGLNLIPVSPCGHPLQQIREAPDFAAMIPMQVFNSFRATDELERLKRIRHLIIGGGAIDHTLGQKLLTFPHAVWSTYGMTETLSHIALRRLNGPEASEWYTPFKGISLSLSEHGTLVIDAPGISPERLVTNDLAELDDRQRFRITGRRDNTINTGGVKVQIEEIETALHPFLPVPFLITAVPDCKFGERIVLLLQADCQTCPQEEVEKALRQLPPYWKAKQTFRVSRLPLTETGKPNRALARQMATEESQSNACPPRT